MTKVTLLVLCFAGLAAAAPILSFLGVQPQSPQQQQFPGAFPTGGQPAGGFLGSLFGGISQIIQAPLNLFSEFQPATPQLKEPERPQHHHHEHPKHERPAPVEHAPEPAPKPEPEPMPADETTAPAPESEVFVELMQ